MSEGELYKKILGEKKLIIRRNKDSGIEEVVITGIREVLDEAKKDILTKTAYGNSVINMGGYMLVPVDVFEKWFGSLPEKKKWFGGAEKK